MESKYYEIWTTNEAGEGSPYKFNGVHRKDLETENWELSEFVDFVDKTNPELRVAYEAAQKLEGANT